MKTVLHIGADAGEFEQYNLFGTKDLVYVEPDVTCLERLRDNQKKHYDANGKHMNINIIPKACSSVTGLELSLNANGLGQSSIQKPGPKTTQIAGDNFKQYNVETVSLDDLINLKFFNSKLIDYLCIDVQGHEESIVMQANPALLKEKISIIDIELMTDQSQYEISPESWKNICTHLIKSGFEPLLHPSGLTESFLFVNLANILISKSSLIKVIESARDDCNQELFGHASDLDARDKPNLYASVVPTGFLPITHAGGVVHSSMVDRFRKLVLTRYSAISAIQI